MSVIHYFNLESDEEIDFEKQNSRVMILLPQESNEVSYERQQQQKPAPFGETKTQNCRSYKSTTVENMQEPPKKYEGKNFPTLSLKFCIAQFKCFLPDEQALYPGFQELLMEKARMLEMKKQVTFARRHHIKLNRCPYSAQLYRIFLSQELMPAFQQSKRIKDASVYYPCIDKFIKLSYKIQGE